MEDERSLSPLAAYEAVMHFATERGEAALRLALHAAVPQGFQPELLHLLKRNFVPEAADDPAVEADVLFSPLCEEMGRGYFRFDPQVRALLLENLTTNYPSKTSSRLSKVADFIISYVDHQERNPAVSQDQLSRDYLEVQRWVAFAYAQPAAAAQQFAAALRDAQKSNDVAARIQLGGLAGALNAPLAGFAQLLNYAEGLQALEVGNRGRAVELFETIDDEELTIGETTLRTTSQVLQDWETQHPEYVATGPDDQVVQEGAEEKAETIDEVDEAIRALKSGPLETRIDAATRLGRPDAPDKAVQALIDQLTDAWQRLRVACVNALAHIGTEAAIDGLVKAVGHSETYIGVIAIEWLLRLNKRVVLILSPYGKSGPEATAIQDVLKSRDYRYVFVSEIEVEVASRVSFLLVDLSQPLLIANMHAILRRLSVPVQPIARHGKEAEQDLLELQRRSNTLPFQMYEDAAELKTLLGGLIDRIESRVSGEPTVAPQFEYDIFISYAQLNHPAVPKGDEEFVEVLGRELSWRLSATGRAPKIFLDSVSLETGGVRVESAIEKSALYLVILSPSYFLSRRCQSELETIVATSRKNPSSPSGRIFKVIALPLSPQEEPSALRELDAYDVREELFGPFLGTPAGSVGLPIPVSKRQRGTEGSSTVSELDRLTNDIAAALEHIYSPVSPAATPVVSAEPTTTPASNKVDVLVVYERTDLRSAQRLQNHLTPLLRRDRITRFYEMEVFRGLEADHQRIRESDVVLILVSADLLASEFMRSKVIEDIITSGRSATPLVIPIIVKPCRWKQTIFTSLQVLPETGRPISDYKDIDKAYFMVIDEVDHAVERWKQTRKEIGDVPDSTSKSPISRWPVISGLDDDFKAVNQRPVTTTVEKLNELPRPEDMLLQGGNLSRYESRRAAPVETTVWSVEAFITGYKLNASGSFRLTLQGATGATMIAQVPDPSLVAPGSPWADQLSRVRQVMMERFNFQVNYQRIMMRARFTGVGFFNRSHGQIGVAENAIELYPILDFEWLPMPRGAAPQPTANFGGQRKPKVQKKKSVSRLAVGVPPGAGTRSRSSRKVARPKPKTRMSGDGPPSAGIQTRRKLSKKVARPKPKTRITGAEPGGGRTRTRLSKRVAPQKPKTRIGGNAPPSGGVSSRRKLSKRVTRPKPKARIGGDAALSRGIRTSNRFSKKSAKQKPRKLMKR